MATNFQWTELFLKYSKTIASTFLFIVGLSGYGVYDFFKTSKNKAIHEVATAFQVQIPDVIEEKPVIKKVVIIKRCDTCLDAINKLRKEFH